ncbi:TRAP transporter small permease subunit [Paracoccaceae bacterium]|nr:TRAP transporter small permease subunit [Paracoccaceae bacterium]
MNSSSLSGSETLDGRPAVLVRIIGWSTLAFLTSFFVNNIINVRYGVSSGGLSVQDLSLLNLAQSLIYGAAFVGVIAWVLRTSDRPLRVDAKKISNFNAYIIRGCFFAVLFVGLVDASIAWLRVERLLPVLFSADLASALLRSSFIGPTIHIPLVCFGFFVALFSRALGFTWLALMIVLAELLIVISRFVFSYEQSLMGDLVRYWYAALFLFSSAHTLLEEGHVRVDIFFAGLSRRGKGIVNAYGSILLGMATSLTIFLVCLWSKQAIVNSPVMNFEVSQTGTAGMYIKYQMAAFLLIFAITMQVQFVSYFFDAVADMRNEPGKQAPAPISH